MNLFQHVKTFFAKDTARSKPANFMEGNRPILDENLLHNISGLSTSGFYMSEKGEVRICNLGYTICQSNEYLARWLKQGKFESVVVERTYECNYASIKFISRHPQAPTWSLHLEERSIIDLTNGNTVELHIKMEDVARMGLTL